MSKLSVVITRNGNQAHGLSVLLESHVRDLIVLPSLKIAEIPLTEGDVSEVLSATQIPWLFVTSVHAVFAIKSLVGTKFHLAVVGQQTAKFCESEGIQVSFVPRVENRIGLFFEFMLKYPEVSELRTPLFLFQGDTAGDYLKDAFLAEEIPVKKFICYSVTKEVWSENLFSSARSILSQKDSILTFYSSLSIQYFIENIKEYLGLDILDIKDMRCIVVGESTDITAHNIGFTNVIRTKSPSDKAFLDRILELGHGNH